MIYLHNSQDPQDIYIPRQDRLNVEKTGIDLSAYLTSGETIEIINETVDAEIDERDLVNSAETQSMIDSSLSGYATEQWVESQGYLTEHQSLEDYWTSAQTESAITVATDDMATETWVENQGYLTEHQSLSAYSTTVQVEGMISSAKTEIEAEIPTVPTNVSEFTNDAGYITSADTVDFVTSADVKTQVEAYNYVNSGQVQTQIDDAISGITIDLSDYWTSAETQSAITEATENFVTSGEVNTIIENKNYTTSAETETQIESYNYVNSADVKTQIEGYNYITSGDAQTQIDAAISGIPKEFKTINNESIIGTGNITISAGTIYSAGTNIDITNDVISVTGITVPTKVSELTNDAKYFKANNPLDYRVSSIGYSANTNELYYKPIDYNGSVYIPTKRIVYLNTINGNPIASTDSSRDIEIDVPTSNTAFTNDAGYITSADTVDFVTSADVQTQVQTYNYVNSGDVKTQVEAYNYITSAETKTQIEGYNYITSGDAQTQINTSLSGKQDTLVSGTNIKTINNESILGSGNITIQGGGGSGSESVVELTKTQYEALSAYAPDTTYVITDADSVDLNDFATSGQVAELSAITSGLSSTVEGKADKVTVSANSSYYFPAWNNQGVITGTRGSRMYQRNININGTNQSIVRTNNNDISAVYAPTTAGSAGQLVTSNGSGAPSWTQYSFAFLTQDEYDALTTKSQTTIYFITD